MEHLPFYIPLVMGLSTFLAIYLFIRSAQAYTTRIWVLLILWLVVQAGISFSGFYTVTNVLPPRFLLAVLPPALLILFLFVSSRGRKFIDGLDLKALTLLHLVRIPVEIVLLWLYQYKKVPELMTFEGQNFDIFSGLTAPLIYYLAFVRKSIGTGIMLMWNFVCLILLANIVSTAILSAPSPFQQFAFEQPNVGIFYFPFIWLPCCIVPVVLLAHLAAIRQLMNE